MKTTIPVTDVRAFPDEEICGRIRELWNERIAEEAENPFARAKTNTLHAMLPDIDSLTIVKFMLRIEEIIDIEIPPKFIKRGGYRSSDEMISHILPQIRTLYATPFK